MTKPYKGDEILVKELRKPNLRSEIEELAEEMILTYDTQRLNVPINPADRKRWLYNVWVKHVEALFEKRILEVIPKRRSTKNKLRPDFSEGHNQCRKQILNNIRGLFK